MKKYPQMKRNVKGKKNPNYKGGWKSFCKDCKRKISFYAIRCASCCKKGDLNPHNHKGNREKFCKLISKLRKGQQASNKTKKLISLHHADFSGNKNPMFGKITHGKGTYYKDIYMRSSYELAYAKYLDKNHIKWCYESKTFDLGNCTYTPDFYLPESDTYIEIKGWWRDKSKEKFVLFKKIYSDIKISILDRTKLQSLRIL